MLQTLGPTRRHLLKALLARKAGLSADELAQRLNITRTAVRQHVAALEGQGYLRRIRTASTGGRPGQKYALTEPGHGLFPKQYSFFSEALLDTLRAEKGEAGLRRWLRKLGRQTARALPGNTAAKPVKVRIQHTAALLNQLAYEATAANAGGKPVIEATNCVYHNLAATNRAVCQFDIGLLETLTGMKVEQQSCIQDGHNTCRFCLHERKAASLE